MSSAPPGSDGTPTSRRAFLVALGSASVAGLSGCGAIDDATSTGRDCPGYDPIETAGAEWTTAMGDAAGTATVAPSAAPGTDLSLEWTFPIETHVGYHVPVVADGTVFVHDMDATMSAVDAASGEPRWSVPVESPRRAPAVGDGTVVVLTEHRVEAFSAATGERRWTALDVHPHLFAARPIVADGTVYAMVGVAIHALDLETGDVRWRVSTGLPSRSTPAVRDGTVYVAGDEAYVRALSTADGAERWRAKTQARVRCNVSVADGTVCTATTDGAVVAMDAGDGSEQWRQTLPDAASPQVRPRTVNTDGGRVYVTTDDHLHVLAADSGDGCWRSSDYRGSYASGVAVGDGRVYVPAEDYDADFATLDAASGDRLAAWGGGEDTNLEMGPAIADGAVYSTGNGALGRFG